MCYFVYISVTAISTEITDGQTEKTTNKYRKQKWEAKQDYRYLKQHTKEIVIDMGWGKT